MCRTSAVSGDDSLKSLSTMEEYIQSTMLHLDPVEGKRTEGLTPPLDLASYLSGCTVESIFTTDHEKINLKHIREHVAEHVEEPHKVENFVNALVDADLATLICGEDLRNDPAELKKVLDEEHITEGFEILDKVEALQNKYLLATRKTQLLKFNVWDLTEKIKLLESDINLQEHQIREASNREEEQDALVLSPLRSIYMRHFHDQVRERIAEKLSATTLYAQHQRALHLRVHGKSMNLRCGEEKILQLNLWRLMQEMHTACPESFSMTTMWNQFVDELLGEEALVRLLSLSPQAILITRFGSPAEDLATQNPQNSGADAASALRNKHVFAELVTRQDEEQRPAYSELYRFLFDSAPETMNFKAICSPAHKEQGVFLPSIS